LGYADQSTHVTGQVKPLEPKWHVPHQGMLIGSVVSRKKRNLESCVTMKSVLSHCKVFSKVLPTDRDMKGHGPVRNPREEPKFHMRRGSPLGRRLPHSFPPIHLVNPHLTMFFRCQELRNR